MDTKPSTSHSPDYKEHLSDHTKDHDTIKHASGKDLHKTDHVETHKDGNKDPHKTSPSKELHNEITDIERSKLKKQHIAETQQKQVLFFYQNKEVLEVLTEEQKRDRERAKQLEKVSDPVEREKLELKFDGERAKIKQKMKNMVKRHAEEISKLEHAV